MEIRAAEYLQENPGGNSVSPLPSRMRYGLIAISVFALLSFCTTTCLWLYLNYRLISWRLKRRSRASIVARNLPDQPTIPNLDFNESPFSPDAQNAKDTRERNLRQIHDAKHESPNQFLVLIFNLFLADMHQSAAFLLSASWLRQNGIFIKQATCFVQGYFDSNGDLSSSCFITFIAMHTYLSVVWGYHLPQRTIYICCGLIWIFVYCLSTVPLIITGNGRAVGGYFVRAGPWCWINSAYEDLRLATHYIFIFIALATTSSLYMAIFFSLRKQVRVKDGFHNLQLSHKPAFLVYPIIYVLCTLPLAAGRIAAMAGAHVPTEYYCFAGTMIAANGVFDSIIFGITRHSIVFGSKHDVNSRETGLETFSFMRTPIRDFGHEVWIQGGKIRSHSLHSVGIGGWMNTKSSGDSEVRVRSLSQESLRPDDRREMAIQMDVVTSMTVEDRHRELYTATSLSEDR